MTIPPIIIVIIVAVIVILALSCFCFALAWIRAETEISQMRRNRVDRALRFHIEEPR